MRNVAPLLLLLLVAGLFSLVMQTSGCKYNLRMRKYSCDNGGQCITNRYSSHYCQCRRGYAGKVCERKCFEKNTNIRDCCSDLLTTCAYANSDDVCGYKRCLQSVLNDRLSCPDTSRARHDIVRSINNIGRQCK